MAIRSTHPLKQNKITHLQNWKQWMEIWNNNPCLEVRHSLLHFGLEMPLGQLHSKETDWKTTNETYSERILFYLSVADGWHLDPQSFALELPERRSYRGGDPRFDTSLGVLEGNGVLGQRLAQKAFVALFNALIPRTEVKGEREQRIGLNSYHYGRPSGTPYYQKMSSRETVALLRFFRPVGDSLDKGVHLQNFPDRTFFGPLGEVTNHLIERVRNFLSDYLVFLWENKEPVKPKFYGEARDAEIGCHRQEALNRFSEEMAFYSLLKRRRFLMAVMLLCLGKSERLYPLDKDERTLKFLHQFAMSAEVTSEIYYEKEGRLILGRRRPQSLEEAWQYGRGPRSEAAKYLLFRAISKKAENEHRDSERPHKERLEAELEQWRREEREKEAEALRKKADELLQGSQS